MIVEEKFHGTLTICHYHDDPTKPPIVVWVLPDKGEIKGLMVRESAPLRWAIESAAWVERQPGRLMIDAVTESVEKMAVKLGFKRYVREGENGNT